MDRPINPEPAAERSRWLAELAQTTDQALRLGRRMGIPHDPCVEGREIYSRLESLRIEVESLRRGRRPLSRKEIGPLWTRLLPWNAHPED